MPYTYNITFVTAPALEADLTHYLKTGLIPGLVAADATDIRCQIKKIVEVAGETPAEEDGVSIALSVEFPDEKSARGWYGTVFRKNIGSFHKRYGENALCFVTFLKSLT